MPDELRSDLMADLSAALEARVKFSDGYSPESLFRAALQASFPDISMHPRGKEFQQLLLLGPAPIDKQLRPFCAPFLKCLNWRLMLQGALRHEVVVG